MKKTIMFAVLALSLSAGSLAFAKSPAQCAGTAKGAADDFMSQVLDEECANARATIESASVDNGDSITYQVDVVCGPASVPANHHSHTVILNANTCAVIRGGGGDA